MAKRERSPLVLKNNFPVRTLEELQEHFDMDRIISYYHDGQLIQWLSERYYEDEYQKVINLSSLSDEKDLRIELCLIFNISSETINGLTQVSDEQGVKQENRQKARTKVLCKVKEENRETKEVERKAKEEIEHRGREGVEEKVTEEIKGKTKEKETGQKKQREKKKETSVVKKALICTMFLGGGVVLFAILGSKIINLNIPGLTETTTKSVNAEIVEDSLTVEVAFDDSISTTTKGYEEFNMPESKNVLTELTELEKVQESKVNESMAGEGKKTTQFVEMKSSTVENEGSFIPEVFYLKNTEGTIFSIAGIPSGEYYMIVEKEGGEYLIVPNGNEVDISDYYGTYFGYSYLSYNQFQNEIYLLRSTNGTDLWIFRLDDIGNQELVFFLEEDVNYQMYGSCDYFSDGVMLCGVGGNILIDTVSWTERGSIPILETLKILNDNIYIVGSGISQIDFQGNVLEDFDTDTSGAYAEGSPGCRFFSDGQAIYFGKSDGFYMFNGNDVELYVLISNFKYAGHLSYNFLCVTNVGIRYYDWNEKVLKEIRRNDS